MTGYDPAPRVPPIPGPLPEWKDEPACTGLDTEIFFPLENHPDAIERAEKICRKCPVSAQCLEYARKENIGYGIWGGWTPSERRSGKRAAKPRIRRDERSGKPSLRILPPTPWPRCGTITGYNRHNRLMEKACDACRKAKCEYSRQRKKRLAKDPERINNANLYVIPGSQEMD
jgi:WhiB family transcriptional regulator, redox-sensing transcriptional regulator